MKSKPLWKEKKKLLENLIEFIEEIRTLNQQFQAGKKFNYRIQAYVSITIPKPEEQIEIFENVWRINLKKKKMEYPHIYIYYHDRKGNLKIRLPNEKEKEKYSDLRKIVEEMVDNHD